MPLRTLAKPVAGQAAPDHHLHGAGDGHEAARGPVLSLQGQGRRPGHRRLQAAAEPQLADQRPRRLRAAE